MYKRWKCSIWWRGRQRRWKVVTCNAYDVDDVGIVCCGFEWCSNNFFLNKSWKVKVPSLRRGNLDFFKLWNIIVAYNISIICLKQKLVWKNWFKSNILRINRVPSINMKTRRPWSHALWIRLENYFYVRTIIEKNVGDISGTWFFQRFAASELSGLSLFGSPETSKKKPSPISQTVWQIIIIDSFKVLIYWLNLYLLEKVWIFWRW